MMIREESEGEFVDMEELLEVWHARSRRVKSRLTGIVNTYVEVE